MTSFDDGLLLSCVNQIPCLCGLRLVRVFMQHRKHTGTTPLQRRRQQGACLSVGREGAVSSEPGGPPDNWAYWSLGNR